MMGRSRLERGLSNSAGGDEMRVSNLEWRDVYSVLVSTNFFERLLEIEAIQHLRLHDWNSTMWSLDHASR